MITTMNWYALIWVGIIAFGIIMYVILDGFDLGIGILTMWIPKAHDRDIMISTILPVWDGNETWLVFGGAALYGAFPLAFATILPILYIPILIMVSALLFRGVAFEFRLKATHGKALWEWSFFVGSLVATFIQGVMLGAFVQGFHVNSGQAAMRYHWLSPFSITCGVALVFGYALLACNWLIARTVGELQQRFYRLAKISLVVVAVFAVAISFWSPFIDPALASRWFDPKLMPYLGILPVITLVLFVWHWLALRKQEEYRPFWLAIFIFVLCYIGFIISSYPYIVPRSITFIEAAAPNVSLRFMLIGAIIMLPILLYYTFHAYRIFKGKVTEVIAY